MRIQINFWIKESSLSLNYRQYPPDIIIICEILRKAPNAVVDLSLIALPGYYCYLNFDPNNYDPTHLTYVE